MDAILEKDKGWRPNLRQELFLSIPWSIKEVFYGGGNGSGKSDVLLYYPLVHKLHLNPRFKQVFLRRTFPELRNEIVPRSREIYRRFGATFSKSDMCWTFPRADQYGGNGSSNDGAMIYLGHCETEEDVHKYDSMEINLFTPDEVTSLTEWIYLYIGLQRTRTSDKTLPAIIRSAGTPGNIGHTWVKKRFVDPCPDGGKVLIGRGGLKRVFVRATLADNPHIDPGYRNSLSALPEAEKNAKLHGSFDAYLGSVFSEFRDRRYPDEPETALHVIEPFDVPDFWPRLTIGDWGFRAMTYVMHAAISPTKRVYIYLEQAWQGKQIEEWAPEVKYIIERDKPRKVVFCQSTAQKRGTEHTIQEQISYALGYTVDLSDNSHGSRIAGKALLHEYLRWNEKPILQRENQIFNEVYAAWLVRNKSESEYKKYLKLFAPAVKEENLPKLLIFNHCPLVINAIKVAQYAKPKDGILAEDIAEFNGDDPLDTVRYLVDAADRYFEEAEMDFEAIKMREEIVQKMHGTGDMTSFYMQMRELESAGKSDGPVKRYHSGARR